MPKPTSYIDTAELNDALALLKDMEKKVGRSFVNKSLRKHAKPMLMQMKRNAPTADNDNIERNLKISTAKRKVRGSVGVRVGVLGNATTGMDNFSAPALAAVLEYGTPERFRQLKTAGFVVGRASTGRVTDKRKFLRPAFDAHKERLLDNLEKDVTEEVRKLG